MDSAGLAAVSAMVTLPEDYDLRYERAALCV